MPEFDKLRFLHALQELPARKSPLREPRYSEYLKTQVFDALRKDGTLDLRTLDLSAVSLHDLTPEGYPGIYQKVVSGWAQGLNHAVKKMPAAYLKQKAFF